MQKVATNFIYPNIKESDRVFGSAISLPILRENGDWRDSLPPTEDQNIRGIESSACYIEAQQHSIATLLEEVFKIPNENFSARFNALLSNGTQNGGDPVQGAKSIKYDGLIPEDMMSFGPYIQSWDDFHSWKGVNMFDCKKEGKNWLSNWSPNFKIIVEKDYALETKYLQIREYLKRGTCPISVTAWYEKNDMYYKPNGLRDNHLVEAVYIDEQNRIHIRDTYYPYDKILEPNYDFEFALVWLLDRNTQKKSNWLLDILKRLLSW